MRALLAIVGPTGVGKSRLALYLAEHFPIEIINADSRQVYRFMDIGTAKPTPQERELVPHHLLDIVNPDQEFNLALYLKMTRKVIEEVQNKGKLPVLVGGSGQYVWATVEGWQIPPVPPDKKLRVELEESARKDGAEKLYQRLKELDPEAASRIDPRNIRRVVRALEVCYQLGSFSHSAKKQPPPFLVQVIGLTLPRQELYQRIDLRIEEMIKKGWIAEVERLLNMGYDPSLPALSSLGYKELIDYLRKERGFEETLQQIKWRSHNFARHQYAWFRLSDPRINWFQAQEEAFPQIKSFIDAFRDVLSS